MTGSSSRRVDRLERDADASAAVLDWLDSAHRHLSRDAYVVALADLDPAEVGLPAIWARLDAMIEAQPRSKPRTDDVALVRRAKADATFLYVLAINLDRDARKFAELESLRVALLSADREAMGDMRVPMSPVFSLPLDDGAEDGDAMTWAGLAELELATIDVEERARHSLEEHYFDGRPVLFEQTSNDWARLRWLVDRLREDLAIDDRSRAGRGEPSVAPGDLDTRIAARASDLEGLARVDGLRLLGERDRAQAIVDRRVRELLGT